MDLVKKLVIQHGLGDRERKVLKILFNHNGKATWTDFMNAPKPDRMVKRTLSKALGTLIDIGVMEKRKERVDGRVTWVYVFKSKEVEDLFSRMGRELYEETKRLMVATHQPELNVTDRGKRLIDGVHTLLTYQRSLTLMAMKLALSAPSEEKAAHRFLVLMDTFTPDAAGNALWLCWLNKDMAADVLEVMLQKDEG